MGQILDSTAQQTLLTVAVIIRNGPPKKYLFPEARQPFANDSPGITYSSTQPQELPLSHQQPSLSPLRGKVQIHNTQNEYDSVNTNSQSRTYASQMSNSPSAQFSQYEPYQSDGLNAHSPQVYSTDQSNVKFMYN